VDDALLVGSVDGAGESSDRPRGPSNVLRPAGYLLFKAAAVDVLEGQIGEPTGSVRTGVTGAARRPPSGRSGRGVCRWLRA
jgi:hypothetical protein